MLDKHTVAFFPCTIRSSGAQTAFLGKVGHLLIMELHHLTINHESNLGTAQQKHRLSISCPGHHSKCHCLIHSWSTVNLVLSSSSFFAHWRQHSTGVLMQTQSMYAAMSPSEVECYSCKLSSLWLHQISVIQQCAKNRHHIKPLVIKSYTLLLLARGNNNVQRTVTRTVHISEIANRQRGIRL